MREMINVYRTKMDKLDAITRWLIGQRNEYFCYFVNTEKLYSTDVDCVPAVTYPNRPDRIFEELYRLGFYDISKRIEDDRYILINLSEVFHYTPPVATNLEEVFSPMGEQPTSTTDKEV